MSVACAGFAPLVDPFTPDAHPVVIATELRARTHHVPQWFRDLDGDGTPEALFFHDYGTSVQDLQGRNLSYTMPHFCAC